MTQIDVEPTRVVRAEQRDPLLEVEDLRVAFGHAGSAAEVVRGVSFTLEAGRALAIVGESGSGKSVTARSLLGLAGPGSTVTARTLEFGGTSLLGLDDRRWRAIRGKSIGLVLQDALVSLDPLRPTGKEVGEALSIHGSGSRAENHRHVIEALRSVGIPDPEVRARQRSGELSGGLRQRALIASGLVLDPPLLIADEPTTALDTTIQAQILSLLRDAKARGKALLLISHDLSVVGQIADDVLVMRHGEVVEHGPARRVLSAPETAYTASLLGAMPSFRSRGRRLATAATERPEPRAARRETGDGASVLEVRGVSKAFRLKGGAVKQAVRDVSFELRAGETLGIVGESGSGKTTTMRMILGLVEPDEGEVRLDGEQWSSVTERRRRPRRRRLAAVYQDPLGSFDPRWSVQEIIRDALPAGVFRELAQRERRVHQLLDAVGLAHGVDRRRPLNLSGGERQRVAIARALASEPEILVLDEPVSALDVSIQAQVLDLFQDLQAELGLSYLFISHDLGVISHVSDRVIVMKDGRVVEAGDVDAVFTSPTHDYTRALLNAVPALHIENQDLL